MVEIDYFKMLSWSASCRRLSGHIKACPRPKLSFEVVEATRTWPTGFVPISSDDFTERIEERMDRCTFVRISARSDVSLKCSQVRHHIPLGLSGNVSSSDRLPPRRSRTFSAFERALICASSHRER